MTALPFRPRLLFVALAFAATAAAARLPPTDDFVRWPEVNAVTISEDGTFLAFLSPSGRRFFNLNCTHLTSGKSEQYNLQGFDVYALNWIDDHRLLVHAFHPERLDRQIATFDAKKGKVTGYLLHTRVNLNVLSHLRRDEALFLADFPAGQQYDDGRAGLAIISSKLRPTNIVGVKDQRYMVKEWLEMPGGEYRGALTDMEGELRVLVIYRDGRVNFHYRTAPDAAWQLLPFDHERTNILAFDEDPDCLYVGHYAPDSTASTLHRYRVSTGEFGPALYSDPYYSMYDASISTLRPARGKARNLALNYQRDVRVQIPLDPEFAAIQQEINALLPGRLNLIEDGDRNLNRLVVSSTSGRETPRYLIYTRQDRTLSALPEGRPWLKPEEASLMQPVRFASRDGLQLEGYLSLPAPRADGRKPPLIVNPHGGPWVRDTWGFNTEVQFFTSRGYAVFQPNYRGSTGYNAAISKADAFEFRKMHDDVTDGVQQLIRQGVVDGARVAIFGGSFGGYLAVAGAAFEPDLYRCAITFAGVFDWQQMIRQQWADSKHDRFNYDYLKAKLGDPKQQEDRFESISPINHIAAIRCPVYVIHGKLDGTVNYKQSTRLLGELAAHGVPHEKLFFDTEYHGFSEREHYRKFLEAVEAFLARHL